MTEKTIAQGVILFSVADAEIARMGKEYAGLSIADMADRDGYAAVHKARMVVKGYRVDVERTRKELKADALEYGRKVDTEAKRLTSLLSPIEDRLSAEEKRIDDEKAEVAAAAKRARRAALDARVKEAQGVGLDATVSQIGSMSDEEFADAVAAAAILHDEGLRMEAALAASLAAEAKAVAEQAKALEAERAALAADRLELEAAQAEQARQGDLARDREEAAAKATQEAEAAEGRRLAAAERAAREQREALERQPEIDRVLAFAESLLELEVPSVNPETQGAIRTVLKGASRSIKIIVDPFA